MVDSIYIHIPFCQRKCSFCDLFSSYNASMETMTKYTEALIEEITQWFKIHDLTGKRVDSIYFGGGTPTALPPTSIKRILEAIRQFVEFDKSIEISIESTPLDINREYANELKKMGVNRISVGIQSFNDDELKYIFRNYTSERAIQILEEISAMQFDNINVDLIYGLPGQTFDSWQRNLQLASQIEGVRTITMYPLVKKNNLVEDPNCMTNQQKYNAYDKAVEYLQTIGWKQFTFVSFSKWKNGCKHEESFFSGNSVVGFGAGSRTYLEDVHYCNLQKGKHASDVITEYIENREKDSFKGVYLTGAERKKRNALLGLLSSDIGCHVSVLDNSIIELLLEYQLITKDNEKIYLNFKGLKYSSAIAEYLINEKF